MLSDHEIELDKMITEDNESFLGIKHSLEDDIRVLTDQLHFMTSLHQLNEVSLNYEINVRVDYIYRLLCFDFRSASTTKSTC